MLHPVVAAAFEDMEEAGDVAGDIDVRVLGGIAHAGLRGQVDHALGLVRRESRLDGCPVGQICVQFHAAWESDADRPKDETGKNVTSGGGTGRGDKVDTNLTVVKRHIGALRDQVAVRYTNVTVLAVAAAFALLVCVRRRWDLGWRTLTWWALAALVPVVVLLTYNARYFEGPLSTGYSSTSVRFR